MNERAATVDAGGLSLLDVELEHGRRPKSGFTHWLILGLNSDTPLSAENFDPGI